MKNFFLTVLFVLISSISFADQGEIKQHGIFTGQSKIIGDDKGNFTVTYDGVIGLIAIDGTTFGDKTSSHCLGSIVSVGGKGFESGTCINKFEDGGTATIHYEGEFGKEFEWKYVSGTGKYANISGGGTSSYKPFNSAKDGVVQSFNEFSGTYNLN
jgi:hypothetical protein